MIDLILRRLKKRPLTKGRLSSKIWRESFDLGKMRLLSFKTLLSPAFFGLCRIYITYKIPNVNQ